MAAAKEPACQQAPMLIAKIDMCPISESLSLMLHQNDRTLIIIPPTPNN